MRRPQGQAVVDAHPGPLWPLVAASSVPHIPTSGDGWKRPDGPRLAEKAYGECRGMAWRLRPTQNRGTAVVPDHAGELDLRHLQ